MIKDMIILGYPGIGKGTLSKLISEKYGLVHISTGDIFRKNIKEQTELGQKVSSVLASGGYVSDELTNELVKSYLSDPKFEGKGFIFDGYPRTINQAEFLATLPMVSIDNVTLLKADTEIVEARLLHRAQVENRKDDTPEVISQRISIYKEKTAPLIDWYRNKGVFVEVDASGTIEQNMKNVDEAVFND